MEPGELHRGQVAGGRCLGPEAGRVGLREEHVPGVHGAGQGQHEQRHGAPAERGGLPDGEHQDQGRAIVSVVSPKP